jgi:hypothetical protein
VLDIAAPLDEGDDVGDLVVTRDGMPAGEADVVVAAAVERPSLWWRLVRD